MSRFLKKLTVETVRFLERLATIDRRYIYIILAAAVALPLLLSTDVSIRVSPPVVRAYEAIDTLKPGSVLLVSIDYDPTSMPEIQPMLISALRHAFSNGLKVVMMGHLALGIPVGQLGLEQVAREMGMRYGEDYVSLGYRPGYTALMVAMGRSIKDVFGSDYKGTPLDEFPLMKDIVNYEQIDLLLTLAHGYAAEYWAQYAGARYGQRIIVGCTAVVAPDLYPYLQAEQIEGLIGGLKGSAEYETLIGRPGVGTLGMPAQSLTHIVILLFIIIGNIGYFVLKRRR